MIFRFDKQAGAFAHPEITVLESGPVRAVVRIVTRYGRSVLDQRYMLHAGSNRLEVEAHLDMQEKQRILKLCFPTVYPDEYAEIPYGAIKRTACGDEEHCQRWVALQNDRCGLAILNDGKYSYSIENGSIALTVAHTSVFADHYGQAHRDDVLENMDIGKQVFRYALYPYQGGWQQADLERHAALFNRPLPRVVETYHEGPLSGEYCGITLDNRCVSAGAIKRAEDDNGTVIRLHETSGNAQSVQVQAHLIGRSFTLDMRPFEIKTVYLPDDASLPWKETLLTER